MKRALLVLCLALSLDAQQRPEWRDTYQSRVEILALMQTLNAELLASSSATRVLESWCGEYRLAADPRIVAVRVQTVKAPTAEQLQRLGVHDASEVKYRRVQLRCGAHVLSEADNWYVPARLTPEMNALLETTDTPFGKAVQPLRPYRRTIEMKMLWTPLPSSWAQQPRPRCSWRRRPRLAIPEELFQHRAVLYTPEHVAFSEVVETYQDDVLAIVR